MLRRFALPLSQGALRARACPWDQVVADIISSGRRKICWPRSSAIT